MGVPTISQLPLPQLKGLRPLFRPPSRKKAHRPERERGRVISGHPHQSSFLIRKICDEAEGVGRPRQWLQWLQWQLPTSIDVVVHGTV